jgi:hypothetical protein
MVFYKIVTLLIITTLTSSNLWAGDKFSDVITSDPTANNEKEFLPFEIKQTADAIYDSMQLGEVGLERDLFYKAYKGYHYLLLQGSLDNVRVISIADFSQSSRNKRLYIIDLYKKKLLYNTYVSHGKNSGGEMATSFSNLKDSFKSTLGFMITTDTYVGGSGYSLRFKGMEPGINDRVKFRDIIVHGSRYVNAASAEEDGAVGNSLGCPAVPLALSRKIIDTIKGGSMYFIYNPDENYNAASPILNADLKPAKQLINTNLQPQLLPEPIIK